MSTRKLERQIARAQAPNPMTAADEIVLLKAAAYDVFAQIQQLNQRVQQINARIAELELAGKVAPIPAPNGRDQLPAPPQE